MEKKVRDKEELEHNPLLGAVRKVLLASIGAVAMAQDEMEDFVEKLVERGEIAEKDGKQLVRDLQKRRKQEMQGAEEKLDQQVEEVLQRMDVPTKSDIEDLSAKISALTEKVEELNK